MKDYFELLEKLYNCVVEIDSMSKSFLGYQNTTKVKL